MGALIEITVITVLMGMNIWSTSHLKESVRSSVMQHVTQPPPREHQGLTEGSCQLLSTIGRSNKANDRQGWFYSTPILSSILLR
ncbi:hypothetical protein FHW67_002551 [Herbaspirillum sp. Sphag1AN]|nr:hypothetical protein [Herbaspirillum sp. Sphag1AN]MBB3246459.1 hypothetical protein [Herbaspirillum sp. Sphag64]